MFKTKYILSILFFFFIGVYGDTSSVLLCIQDTWELQKNYKKTEFELSVIDISFKENKCSGNNSGSILCKIISEEKKHKTDLFNQYSACQNQKYTISGIKNAGFVSSFYYQILTGLFGKRYATFWLREGWKDFFIGGVQGVRALGVSRDGGFYVALKSYNQLDSEIFMPTILYKIHKYTPDGLYYTIANDDNFQFLSKQKAEYKNIKDIIQVQEYANGHLYVLYANKQDEIRLMRLDLFGKKDTGWWDIKIADKNELKDALFLGEEYIITQKETLSNGLITTLIGLSGKSDKKAFPWTTPMQSRSIIWQQPDGHILFPYGNGLARVSADGVPDKNFKNPNFTYKNDDTCGSKINYLILPDGKIFIYGNFSHINNVVKNCSALLSQSGEVIETFVSPKLDNNWTNAIANFDSQSNIIIKFQGQLRPIRIYQDGRLDTESFKDIEMSEATSGVPQKLLINGFWDIFLNDERAWGGPLFWFVTSDNIDQYKSATQGKIVEQTINAQNIQQLNNVWWNTTDNLPFTVLSTFEYGGEKYIISTDHIIYKIVNK